jgi:CDP-diacylglycerol--serine O-phosphatidyltransferase
VGRFSRGTQTAVVYRAASRLPRRRADVTPREQDRASRGRSQGRGDERSVKTGVFLAPFPADLLYPYRARAETDLPDSPRRPRRSRRGAPMSSAPRDRKVKQETKERLKRSTRRRGRLRARRDGGKRRPNISPVAVPSFFTLMNLFSGFLAITQIAEGNFREACWLIVLAAFFDALDGFVARLTGGDSPFGVELDSLCDVVSFGTAPAFLIYAYGLSEYGFVGVVVAALPALCGAVRLARFNVMATPEKKGYFSGLPIPMPAMTIVALLLVVDDPQTFIRYSPNELSLLFPIVILLSALMVTTIRFDAQPQPKRDYIRAHPRKFTLYLLGVALVIVLQDVGLLIVLATYITLNLGAALSRTVRTVRAEDEPGEQPE